MCQQLAWLDGRGLGESSQRVLVQISLAKICHLCICSCRNMMVYHDVYVRHQQQLHIESALSVLPSNKSLEWLVGKYIFLLMSFHKSFSSQASPEP